MRVWSASVVVAVVVALAACEPAASVASTDPEVAAAAESEQGPLEPRAEFRLLSAGSEREFDWSATSNLVTCQHYPEPERGDYLWIRLGETAEQNGDAGVRLDIDVCRLTGMGEELATMPAGQHGSHCAETPGFAIWWHEGDAAFNTGAGAAGDCQLALDYAPSTQILRGEFECAPLQPVEGEGGERKTNEGRELSLAAGRFSCVVEPRPREG